MAGSYAHVTDEAGRFRGVDLLDNLGDAHEALEECFGMIWFLADRVAGMLHHDQAEPTRDQILDVIRQARASYQDGLSRSESS